MQSSNNGQRGVSMSVVLLIIVLVVFFATLAIKMVPAYLNFLQIQSVMDGLQEKPDIIKAGPRKILSNVDAQLHLNNVTSVTKQDFAFQKVSRDSMKLSVDYQIVEHLFFNVDVLMNFDYQVTLTKP